MDYLKQFNLKGKKAFIVGGSGLLGIQISNTISQAGAKTYILDIKKPDRKKIKNKKNITHVYFNCASINQLEEFYNKVLEKFGTPEIFINCSYPVSNEWNLSNFEQIKLKTLRENIDMHLNSFSWLARLTAEKMRKLKIKGRIIQLGSIYGIVGQDQNVYKGVKNIRENMIYSIIKGGISSLTRQMASYYGQYNIRVNTICPGGIHGHVKGSKKKQSFIFLKNYENKVPLKRLGNPNEIASAALFLSSDSSSYITGIDLIVDGGWTAV